MSEAALLKDEVLKSSNGSHNMQASALSAPARGTKAVSVKPKTSTISSTLAAGKENEKDREHKAYFETWGKREVREGPGKHRSHCIYGYSDRRLIRVPAAQVRRILITDLPSNATPSFVASLVYGGSIEDIQLRSSPSGIVSAFVLFVHAKDCENYYEKTANGIVYDTGTNNRETVAFVDKAKDVDVVGGMLRAWIEQGVTRCVRAVGVPKDVSTGRIRKIAEEKGRRLEDIDIDVNARGVSPCCDVPGLSSS